MNLKLKIEEDLKEAMKQKDVLRLSVLRMLSSAIHNREIEKRTKVPKPPLAAGIQAEGLGTGAAELTEEEVTAALRSEVKKRRDSIVEFEKGGRKDLVEKETAELKILEPYLPQELAEEEIEKIVKGVVAELNEITPQSFGKVMGEVMKQTRGQASGDRVIGIVKKFLPK